MKVKLIIEKLVSKYPQLPDSSYWNKYETISFSDRISRFARRVIKPPIEVEKFLGGTNKSDKLLYSRVINIRLNF